MLDYEQEAVKRDSLKRIYPEFQWHCRETPNTFKEKCDGVKTCKTMYPNLIYDRGHR